MSTQRGFTLAVALGGTALDGIGIPGSVRTLVPGDGILYSPFGWGFYSPILVYRSPFYYGFGRPHEFCEFHYLYGHGFEPRGGLHGGGFRGGGAFPGRGGGRH
jgi:hypothetical protein